MPVRMCSVVHVCVCATAYVCVYAYVRLRNLQERIETGPAQILANYRMLPTCCSICTVPSGFRTLLIMACRLYAYMRMRMYGYVRMRG